jgi:hypothetical protein
MDDAQAGAFFELVNLDYPGLEAVKAAVRSGDYGQAKAHLAQYYRTRTKPGWYCKEPPEGGLYPSLETTTADDVLARRFTISSKTAQLERKIDWAVNPYNDREYTWLLNRHTFFLEIGRAYLRTGEEKYAQAFNEIVTDWITSNPIAEAGGTSRDSWRTLEAGIRMFNTWQMGWQSFKGSPSFTTDARIMMLKSFAEHADYLVKNPRGGNWLLMETNGLLHVGAMFPEFKDAQEWRETAVNRLVEQMRVQVYPDGAQFELTTSYHSISLWNLLHPVILMHTARNFELPKEYIARLEEMFRWSAGVTRPDGKAPMLNDADQHEILRRVQDPARKIGGDKLPEIRDLLDIKPESKSVFVQYSGISCMRAQDLYLMMDAGPYGAGHQHEDKLNLEVYACGRPFVVDPGRFTYTAEGAPFKGTGAHNTILVDDHGQHRRGVDRSKWIVNEPAPGCRWISDDDFDYAEGVYYDGYGSENEIGVTHTRKVFFVKPEYWIVVDILNGDGEHKLEQMWHFMPGKVAVEPGGARTLNDDANLTVVRSDGAQARIVEGEDRPILGYYSPLYNIREPSSTVVFTRTSATPVAFEAVLYPSKGAAVVPEVRPIHCLVDGKRPRPGQVSAISIRLPEYEDIFVVCHDPESVGKVKRFLGCEFAGEALWMRTDLRGKEIGRWLMTN